MFDSFEDSRFLDFVLSWLLNVNGSNGIEKCDEVTYWVQILSDHLGIKYSKIKDVGDFRVWYRKGFFQNSTLCAMRNLCQNVPKMTSSYGKKNAVVTILKQIMQTSAGQNKINRV